MPGFGFCGVDLDALGAKRLGQRGVVPEARDLGREQGRRRGLAPGRIGHLALERPADRVALRRDRLDLARLHLIEEVRAERNLDPRLPRVRGHQNRGPVERQQHEHRDPEPAEAMGRERLVLIGRSAAVRRRGDAPAPVVSGHRRRYRIVSAVQHDVGTASKRTASGTRVRSPPCQSPPLLAPGIPRARRLVWGWAMIAGMSRRPRLVWGWSTALLGAVYALPGAAVMLSDRSHGLALVIGVCRRRSAVDADPPRAAGDRSPGSARD